MASSRSPGGAAGGSIHTVTANAWEATAALNLRTQVLVCAAVARRMLAQAPNDSGTRGSILLMGSLTTSDPAPELFATHAYAAAKGALTALMTTMAATYAPQGIGVNIVAPSLTRTPMAQRAATDAGILAYARRKQPLADEMLDPDDGPRSFVAACCLATSSSHWSVGASLATCCSTRSLKWARSLIPS